MESSLKEPGVIIRCSTITRNRSREMLSWIFDGVHANTHPAGSTFLLSVQSAVSVTLRVW